MSDEPLFTLRELADQLELPESTVRYYRDAFLDHIPSVGTGRRRRYPPAALAVLRSIAKGYSTGMPRNEVLRHLDGAAPTAEPVRRAPPSKGARRPPVAETAEVTNLDLLAAIVDGEREQREALWQMAQEIVRLTGVLENQEKVLGELSEHTGLALPAGEPAPVFSRPPALGDGAPVVAPPEPRIPDFPSLATAPSPPPPAPPPPGGAMPPWLQDLAPPPAAVLATGLEAPEPTPEPAPTPAYVAPDIERLRQELESERAMVERLREAKLKLEQRAADAEVALAEQKGRRRSMLGRLLKSDDEG
jgi:DNA-binding transcriptional MerR regulator